MHRLAGLVAEGEEARVVGEELPRENLFERPDRNEARLTRSDGQHLDAFWSLGDDPFSVVRERPPSAVTFADVHRRAAIDRANEHGVAAANGRGLLREQKEFAVIADVAQP